MNVSIDLLYKRITSMITYFTTVANYKLAHKEFRATRKFCAGILVATLYKHLHEVNLLLTSF